MKNYIVPLFLLLLFISSCTKEEQEQQINLEFKSIHEITNMEAAEILRLNILKEYGGVFKLFELYHNRVRVEGLPCDTTMEVVLEDESAIEYMLSYTSEVLISCGAGWGVYNDRRYFGNVGLGTQVAASDVFDLEMRLSDKQTIAGNFEDDVYTYSNIALRDILITKGMSAELDPTARLYMVLPSCQYDDQNIILTESSIIRFELQIETNEGDPIPYSKKDYAGTVELLEGIWTILFEDGTSVEL
ncbi:MAG: hypothetical protein P1U56_03710 [Saprospiraceae bacterium]|nr:hypothetical protein [Saprospiraceae bacterium]